MSPSLSVWIHFCQAVSQSECNSVTSYLTQTVVASEGDSLTSRERILTPVAPEASLMESVPQGGDDLPLHVLGTLGTPALHHIYQHTTLWLPNGFLFF